MKKKKRIILSTYFVFIAATMVLILVVGFNKTSYAVEGEETPKIVFNNPNYSGETATLKAKSGDKTISIPIYTKDTSISMGPFQPLYVLQYNTTYPTNQEYVEDDYIVDYGISYLLAKSGTINNKYFYNPPTSYYLGNGNMGGATPSVSQDAMFEYADSYFVDSDTYEYPENPQADPDPTNPLINDISSNNKLKGYLLETYATQVAIWLYLNETKTTTDSYYVNIPSEDLTTLKGNVEISLNNILLYSGNFYDNYIKDVIEDAKEFSHTNPYDLSVTIDSNSMTLEDNIYKTGTLNISSTNPGYYLYSVDISGLDGAYFVHNPNYKVPSKILYNKDVQLHIEIPADKVNNTNQKGYIITKAYYKGTAVPCWRYSYNNYRLIGQVDPTFTLTTSTELNIIAVPNTAISTNKVLLIVGTLVVLMGMSIVTMIVLNKQEQQ